MRHDPLLELLRESFVWVGDAGTSSTAADRSGWMREPDLVTGLGPALARLVAESEPTVVLAPESSGFLLGPLVAASLGIGLVAARKRRNALADSDKWLTATTPLDYRGRNLELSIPARLLSGSDRVLAVDDWVDTGGQMLALKNLSEQAGARYVGAVSVVDALRTHRVRRDLGLKGLLNLRDL